MLYLILKLILNLLNKIRFYLVNYNLSTMDKNAIEDGMYKIVYKLPHQSIFEFDLFLKKNENFETVMHETFEQEQIPKILLR